MNNIIINKQEFKQFRDTWYYINKLGDVYSIYSKTLLKPMCRKTGNKIYKYIDVRNKTTHKQQHIAIHRIVAEVWIRPLEKGEQVNHINDNSLDNRANNLQIGSQKDNIKDCYNNNHKISSIKYITIKDKEHNNVVLTFCPLSKFIEYDGHSSKNGSVKRWFTRQWFNKRYEILDYGSIENLEHFKSVTTMADECKPVGQNLSLFEAHSIVNINNEEIV